MNVSAPRRRLARIRCLQECIRCFKERRKHPESLCYIPSEVKYQCTARCFIRVYTEPSENSKRIRDLTGTAESSLIVSGDELYNSEGKWMRVVKFRASPSDDEISFDNDAWILLFGCKTTPDEALILNEVPLSTSGPTGVQVLVNRWPEVVEHHFSLDLRKSSVRTVLPDLEAVDNLRHVPQNWTIEHDQALVRLMSKHISPENEQLGSIKNFVDSIDVSSYIDEYGPACLTDGDSDTYWESDGSQGHHWIQLRMKKGTIIKKMQVTVDMSDDNYLPSKVVVQGGEVDSQKLLSSHTYDWETQVNTTLTLLENQKEHYPVVTIRIKDCKAGGIDTRIRDLKIVSTEERSLGFDKDFFKGDSLIRFPILETYKADELYRRSQLLQRFIDILDSVLQYLVPAWEYSVGSYSSLEFVRQLLPLSKKRLSLIETFLKESSSEPPEMPKLYINRRAAMEHRCDPTVDLDYKNSIFVQIHEGLKPRDRNTKPLNYRWSVRNDQWWECKFLSEGVIDQGGGFRDSLSDLSEELCPSSSDTPVPIPFFIRSPNQFAEDSSVNCDVYVPNPGCREFPRYEWIGQIMGACLRGKENLILSLPSFFWKKLVGERVTWSDYATVDSSEVKVIDFMESTMTSAEFVKAGRNWSCAQSDGTLVSLRVDGDGNTLALTYDDRDKYCEQVRKIRMAESDEQIGAIRSGLLRVVPQAVLDLLTWQELEHRIAGDPEISLEALKRSTHYDDVEEKDLRVKYMWDAIKNFSNEDRSRFLRFITGRRRLPASVYISTGKVDAVDCLPESSTCANMLFLPNFTSAKVAEEKLRYAAYNCMDIDTDRNLWEDLGSGF